MNKKLHAAVCALILALLPFTALPQNNPYQGRTMRKEVYAFTSEPKITKKGDKYEITFAVKDYCDVTVAVVAPDGRIVRHLAAGVLGKNAPYPFKQGSLQQQIEWDGKDDRGKPVPPGCKIRVCLGLKATFAKNIGYDPNFIPQGTGGSQMREARQLAKENKAYLVARKDGKLYVLGLSTRGEGYLGKVFENGKYVKTFWPPSAEDLPRLKELGYRLCKTVWGDEVIYSGQRYGPFGFKGRDPRKKKLEELCKPMFKLAGISEYQLSSRPAELPPSTMPKAFITLFTAKQVRMAADRERDEIYVTPARGLTRIDGKSGKIDDTWFPKGTLNKVSEVCVGPDGLVYISTGACGYGQFISRLTRDGKPVDFPSKDAVPIPKRGKWEGGKGQYGKIEGQKIYGGSVCPTAFRRMKRPIMSLWTGHFGHSNTHERGLYVSPTGHILAVVQYPALNEWTKKHGLPENAPMKRRGANGVCTSYVVVWDKDGNLLTMNAVGDTQNGHGIAMDLYGNIYAAVGGRWPKDLKSWFGIVGVKPHYNEWGGLGSLVKYPHRDKFPFGRSYYKGETIPSSAARLAGYRGKITAIDGAAWIWPGLCCQTPDICTCHNVRYDMDYFARHWIPANYLYSIIVLDANSNIVARLGRYGNVDDTEKDLKEGRDGLRFAWPRAVAVNDRCLYVVDPTNRRILKAEIGYAVTKEAAIP